MVVSDTQPKTAKRKNDVVSYSDEENKKKKDTKAKVILSLNNII